MWTNPILTSYLIYYVNYVSLRTPVILWHGMQEWYLSTRLPLEWCFSDHRQESAHLDNVNEWISRVWEANWIESCEAFAHCHCSGGYNGFSCSVRDVSPEHQPIIDKFIMFWVPSGAVSHLSHRSACIPQDILTMEFTGLKYGNSRPALGYRWIGNGSIVIPHLVVRVN